MYAPDEKYVFRNREGHEWYIRIGNNGLQLETIGALYLGEDPCLTNWQAFCFAEAYGVRGLRELKHGCMNPNYWEMYDELEAFANVNRKDAKESVW